MVGHPMADGSKGIFLFYVVKSDGTRQYRDIARPKVEGAQ
jgi:lantibiotic modifying enzyme